MTSHHIIDGSEVDLGLTFQKKVTNQILDICNPIINLFNINFFSHTRAFHNGTFTSLMTQTELTEYYIKQKFPIRFSQGKGIHLEKGIYVGSCLQDGFDTITLQLRQHFNLDHFIFIIEKQANYEDMYAFAVSPENTQFINQYLNHVDKFNQFLNYYKEKSYPLITKAPLVSYGKAYFSNCLSSADIINLNQDKLEQYKAAVSLKRWHVNHISGKISLSKRELDCLKLIAKSHTIKEIAKILQLSPRTVETYLNNLKLKLQYERRSQLVEFFHDWNKA